MATRRHSLGIPVVAVLAAAVAIVAIGWTGPANSRAAARQAANKAATVQTKTLKKLGTILVNSKGKTLYMFVPDNRKKVTCKGTCAAVWPPLKLKTGLKPTAGGAARKNLLGLDGRVVTYNRWPLYTYIGDSKPGQANGQAKNLNGGLWYVLSPAGKVIKKH
jgi:predicted lipoprotein with Yx(FWY)xxD motif